MTYGTSFNYSDKARLANDDYIRPCNASPEDGILSIGSKLKCPGSISRVKVEKIEGGLMVAGVVVAANCQIALPAFGFIFILVGIVVTAISYREPQPDDDRYSYSARIALTGNSRVLGPICIVVGGIMVSFGFLLCALTKKARRKSRRVGFHCPIHGDFYPTVPVEGAEMLYKKESSWKKIFCLRGKDNTNRSNSNLDPRVELPQCPHSILSSTRSSISSGPLSPCPQPMPFLVTSGTMSGLVQASAGTNLLADQTFGSIRSLSVSREVASFPISRTPTPSPHHKILVDSHLPNDYVNQESPSKSPRAEIPLMDPIHKTNIKYNNDNKSNNRKSVSISLPEDK